MNRSLINTDHNDYYEALVERQTKADKTHDTLRDPVPLPVRLPVLFQSEDGEP